MSTIDIRTGESLEERWVDLLSRVEKPGRYIGGEWNEIRKDLASVRLRVALAFPDVYEIGMSYLGQKILYDRLNAQPGMAAERVFAPWPDMEKALRRAGMPLVSLETKTPLHRFDILGFSLLYELNDSNILTMLDLGGIPLVSAARENGQPLVIGGGPAAFNPEPLADFFDAFVLGDGEEAFPEVGRAYIELKHSGQRRDRILEEISRIRGVYVPSLYAPVRHPGARLVIPEPRPGAPARVSKRILPRLPSDYPERIIVPHVQAVFDRVAVEVARGCPQKCRFCQATSLYFPYRVKPPGDVIRSTLRSLEATGFEDASLSALSVGDYPGLDGTVRALMAELAPQGISLSLSSLRPRSLSAEVADSIIQVRKTGFTLVPEAGTERLRRVINKNMKDEDIVEAAQNAFRHGWRLLKLYFMIGLPTERPEDLEGIEAVIRAVLDAGRRVRNAPPQVHVSISSFIPKPHTPFQWLAMEDAAVLEDKMRFVHNRLKRYRTVRLKFHDLQTSVLEAVFSRGDRRLSGPLREAWRRGARFDSWRDHFRFDIWEQALADGGLDYREYLTALDVDAPLPWEIIDSGLGRDYLRRELDKAFREETTAPCSEVECRDCLGCAPECRPRKEPLTTPDAEPFRSQLMGRPASGVIRYRAFFSKGGTARFLSHNDLANALRRAFRRAGVPILRSSGFHPKMLVSYLPALPLGMVGREECLDLKSDRAISEDEFLQRINDSLPRGIVFLRLEPLAVDAPSLGDALDGMVYSLDWGHADVRRALEAVRLEQGTTELDDAALFKHLIGRACLNPDALGISLSTDGPNRRLLLEMKYSPSGGPRAQDIARALLPALEFPALAMTRERVKLKRQGGLSASGA